MKTVSVEAKAVENAALDEIWFLKRVRGG